MNGDAASIEAEYVRALDSYKRNFNESGKGVAVFRGNKAHMKGGGIKSYDYSVITVLILMEVYILKVTQQWMAEACIWVKVQS